MLQCYLIEFPFSNAHSNVYIVEDYVDDFEARRDADVGAEDPKMTNAIGAFMHYSYERSSHTEMVSVLQTVSGVFTKVQFQSGACNREAPLSIFILLCVFSASVHAEPKVFAFGKLSVLIAD